MTKQDVLKQYFGYDTFRGGQEEIIDALLAGRDVLAVMPTGAGKSVCYQVPACCCPASPWWSPRWSPLRDQVTQLVQMGVPAAYLNSSLTYRQYLLALDRAREGRYKIIYVAPERLDTEGFQSFVRSAQISMVAVDEAHCISQWGNDFRRDYRLIADIRDAIPHVRVIAVTASATAAVVADICEQLHFRKGYRIFKTSFERKNLSFVVRKTDNKLKEICHILSAVPGSAVIYSRTRKGVEEYAGKLRAAGISAEYFHAGLDPILKTERQTNWVKGFTRVLVATNAFGMGIDKGMYGGDPHGVS